MAARLRLARPCLCCVALVCGVGVCVVSGDPSIHSIHFFLVYVTNRYATFMNRDTPNYENIAKSVKSEMTDFVSYYRRFNNVAGKPSFSTLYTAINVMAGHYASYGPKFPIPEKRRKRLQQEFVEISRNIGRNR